MDLAAAGAPEATRTVVVGACTEVAVFARAAGAWAVRAAPLEEAPTPARGWTRDSSLVEGALAGRAIWDVVWLRGRLGATAGRVVGLVEVTLEDEVMRDDDAVDVADGARLRGRAAFGAAVVLGIERAEEVARIAGRLDVCLCWAVGVGRALALLAWLFGRVGLSCISSSFSVLLLSSAARIGKGIRTKRSELWDIPSRWTIQRGKASLSPDVMGLDIDVYVMGVA